MCHHKSRGGKQKPYWSWRRHGHAAVDVCKLLIPYLRCIEKLRRAKLLVKTYRAVTPRNGKYTDKHHIEKRQFELEFFKTSTRPRL